MDSMPSRGSIIVYKSVLSVFTQEFSFVVWLHVRPENEPQKTGKSRYFWVFLVSFAAVISVVTQRS